MSEIVRDVADGKITREEEETLPAGALAQKQVEKVAEVVVEMLKYKDAELEEKEQELKEKEKTKTCGVCFSDVTSGQEDTTTTSCGHLFHTSCLADWLRQMSSAVDSTGWRLTNSLNKICPTCRADVTAPLFRCCSVCDRTGYKTCRKSWRKSQAAWAWAYS
eukprot:COSAG02_NODE_7993_length_2756_cov_1.432066_2_plen_162_part_00